MSLFSKNPKKKKKNTKKEKNIKIQDQKESSWTFISWDFKP